MTSSTPPEPTPDPLLEVLKKIEEHLAAMRKAFVPEDMRAMRFDYNKER